MWLILQQDAPDDFVIATGKFYSVRQFVEYAFNEIGQTIEYVTLWLWFLLRSSDGFPVVNNACSYRWEGSGVDEIGREKGTGVVRVKVNAKYYRPTEVEELLGDATKAKTKLGWEPKISLAVSWFVISLAKRR